VLLFAVAVAVGAVAQERGLSPSFSTMVQTERAFAKMCGERGVRDSFITFFADDVIGFCPHPEKTRETLMKSPPPTTPPTVKLAWNPVYGDISAAGDLGYNTGPFLLTDISSDKRPPKHGIFFSVWRKQKDASWKVALDIGVDTPGPVAALDAPFVAARSEKAKAAAETTPEAGRNRIIEIDREFHVAASTLPLEAAYQTHLHDHARLHWAGKMPLADRKSVLAALAGDKRQLHGETLDGGMSRSGDLAFVYGRYELKGSGEGQKNEKGYYARVWRMARDGKWRIVMNVINPLPAGAGGQGSGVGAHRGVRRLDAAF
jgi:ketosteroid isomerase-like protein